MKTKFAIETARMYW